MVTGGMVGLWDQCRMYRLHGSGIHGAVHRRGWSKNWDAKGTMALGRKNCCILGTLAIPEIMSHMSQGGFHGCSMPWISG